MFKVVTILGSRPEIIRLSQIMPKLDKICEHTIIYTGQNYDEKLKDIFFNELGLRQPDYTLNMRGSFGEQIAILFPEIEKLLKQINPDRVLILGDTNSALSAIVAKRLGLIVAHAEAGNRCYDDRVPEEVNRRIIDQCSDILMPYTERSRQNLIREGFPIQKTFVIGNPIYEVIVKNNYGIKKSQILNALNIKPRKYFLVTLHRSENVDDPKRLQIFLSALEHIQLTYKLPIIVSTHPHTRNKIRGLPETESIRFMEPFGFFDFISLEQNAFCVMTDSGTVQEECSISGVPNVILRDTTERPETIECGSAIITGADASNILRGIEQVVSTQNHWPIPQGYGDTTVSEKVAHIITSFYNKV